MAYRETFLTRWSCAAICPGFGNGSPGCSGLCPPPGLVHSPRGFLFIFRKGRWDLPKGKIDRGETPLQAALREVSEETGLTRLKAGPALPSTFHLYLSDYPGKPRQWILKETHWFVMEASGREPTRPGTGEEIEEVRWLQPSESGLILANTYASLREMIRLACRL